MKNLFEQHISRIQRKIDAVKKISNKISAIRLGLFATSILFGFFAIERIPDSAYTVILIALIVAFLFMVDKHRKVEQFLERLAYLKEIKADHLARISLNWDEISEEKFEFKAEKNHPFAHDLNIIGENSLLKLLNTTIYEGSFKVLASWLLQTNPIREQTIKRQESIESFKYLTILRDRLRVEAKFTQNNQSKGDWSMEKLIEWLRLPQKTGFKIPLILLSILSVTNLVLLPLMIAGTINALFFVISFVSYLTIYKFQSDKTEGLFEAAFNMEKLTARFGNIVLHIEQYHINKDIPIYKYFEVFQKDEQRPSQILRKVRKMAGAASLQTNQVLGPLVNLVIPWDLYYARKLEYLKKEIEPKLDKWLQTFYEMEALSAIANFAMLNPDYVMPSFETDEAQWFNAHQLTHPLLQKNKKVANNFEVYKQKDLFLVTGSNMAGKSTFLRTVGINLVLAFAGAPVNAKQFNTQFFRVFSSININDSLGDGLSHFYAEVKRLKQLLQELDKENELPLFFFVDEIYKGTNNKERYAGSAAFLKTIAGKNGVGMVSTHDLELAELESEIPQLSNWHFAESIENGKMSFEYKFKAGPCPSTNALKIMEIEGLPIL